MNEKEFEQLLDEARQTHNVPPEVPAERMWKAVQAGRSQPILKPRFPLWRAALATAAVLVIGIGIGRWALPEPVNPVVAELAAPAETTPVHVSEMYAVTTLALFDRADALLTDFRMEGCSAQQMESTSRWAGNMLIQTRVLQNSPASENVELAGLLTDLELVLAQIITINPDRCDRDVAWIRSGLTQRATVDRLRAASTRNNQLAPL